MGSRSPIRIKPSPFLRGIAPYRVPKAGAPVDLCLDANEGAVPPAGVVRALDPISPGVVRSYPDSRPLEEMLARRIGLELDRILVTAGGDDAINRLCRAVLFPGREMIIPVPTFTMLHHFGALAGATVVTVPWAGSAYPVEEVERAVGPDTAVITVVSPNNPTGAVIGAGDLDRLSRAAPGAVLLCDFAYVEFAEEDLTDRALGLPNAVVVRTLSKAYGLAGLRVGYALGSAEIIEWMRTAGGPYGVARPSLALAEARLRDGETDVTAYIRKVKGERGRLEDQLTRLGARVEPSQGNFVFARVTDALWARDALAGQGIAVRAFPGAPGLADALRITCPGNERDFDRLCEALATALRPDALLFDMDGVLADVSQSYRQAILATAESYGVTLQTAEVTVAKIAGKSNNDWHLTRRLLAERGVDAPLDEVTRRFEALYQGTPEAPGLREKERLLIGKEVLTALASRVKLGVVTGRPRSDAERFLREKGIEELIPAVVCMEDAPLKPSPDPVRLAMERLGARRAWMVGDTADDVAAARAAGLVPLGVVAPGDSVEGAAEKLTAAGAARVLRQASDVEDLLP